MESKKSVRNLAEAIHSLLGLKKHLTSKWANSVCNIIKDLPSKETSNGSHIKRLNFKKMDSSENKDDDVGSDVSKIQDDLAALNAHLNQLNLQRRQVLNDFLNLKGNIRVFCRIRPIIVGEKFGLLGPVVASDSSNVLLKLSENKSKRYSFDKVFHPASSQDEVFSEIEPMIKSALDGYNVCIFAYGQTGTGKTFTMEGSPDYPGVVPRAIEALFKQAVDSNHTFLFTFSMLEIYLGNLRDLLVPQMTKTTFPTTQYLSIQTDPKGGIEIDNLVAIRVSDFNQAKRLYGIGSRLRSTASTNSNVASSRSHCLIRISLTCFDAPERRRETNKIWMVDLGGSERVLKTKACGRRLEEGKAINLSLSALGDVISALQRRKPHVPYRNSKLTQVLRDSLGEDSKTLMLVHVSPKEEDLCETVCSLGFATRVRSINLGHEESTEVQVKKEVAMAKLLQKVKQLEYERQDVRRDIKKLNEKLQHITGTEPSSDENLEAPHLPNEMPQCNIKTEKHGAGDVTVASSSQLPRFMRPTVCSRRKSGSDQPTIENAQKKVPLPKKRKPLSVRAESVTFPIKGFSEYSSDCSISRISCLAGPNMKYSTDYETEYSQDASECDIKMVVFPEQDKSTSLAHSKSHLHHKSTEKYENRKVNKTHSLKSLTVDNWLRLQKSESTSSTNTHGSKRVLAISLPEKKKSHGQNKAEILQHEKVHNHEFTKQKFFNHDKIEKQADSGVIGRYITEVLIEETRNLLDDFVIGDSGSNPISPDDKVKEETQGSLECFKDGQNPISPPDMGCDGFNQKKDYCQETGISAKQVPTDETQIFLESCMVQDSGCTPFSPSNIGTNIIKLNEESHDPVLKSKMESESQGCPAKTSNETTVGPERTVVIDQKVQIEALVAEGNVTKEESEKVDFCHSPQYVEGIKRPCLHTMRSRRALFLDLKDAKQVDCTTSFTKSHEKICSGILDLLGQKVQILCAGALLGLGVQSLGLGHDFFDGLML